jgi:hypothetical protein
MTAVSTNMYLSVGFLRSFLCRRGLLHASQGSSSKPLAGEILSTCAHQWVTSAAQILMTIDAEHIEAGEGWSMLGEVYNSNRYFASRTLEVTKTVGDV